LNEKREARALTEFGGAPFCIKAFSMLDLKTDGNPFFKSMKQLKQGMFRTLVKYFPTVAKEK
jgi:hypothetical protein